MTTLCENEHVVSSQLLFDYIFLHFLCIPLVRSNLHCYNGLVTSLSYGTKRNICTTRTDTIWFINIEYNTYSTAHRRFIVSLVLNTQNILTHNNVFYLFDKKYQLWILKCVWYPVALKSTHYILSLSINVRLYHYLTITIIQIWCDGEQNGIW